MRAFCVFALLFIIEIESAEFPCKDGSTFHHQGSCSMFYACYETDKPVLVYCPDDKEYNHKEGKCDFPEEANCVVLEQSVLEGTKKDESGSHEDRDSEETHHWWANDESKEESIDSREDKGEENVEGEEDKSLEGLFSWFGILDMEVRREDEVPEEHSESEEKTPKEDTDVDEHASVSEESGEVSRSFWKRQIPHRFRRSEKASKEKSNEGHVHSGTAVKLDDVSSHKDASDKNSENKRQKRSPKKHEDESVVEEEEVDENQNKNESKDEENRAKESKEEITGSEETKSDKESSKESANDSTNTDQEESVDTKDDSAEPVDADTQTDDEEGGCGLLVVSDPFQSDYGYYHYDSLPDKYSHMNGEYPFVLDTLMIALPEEEILDVNKASDESQEPGSEEKFISEGKSSHEASEDEIDEEEKKEEKEEVIEEPEEKRETEGSEEKDNANESLETEGKDTIDKEAAENAE